MSNLVDLNSIPLLVAKKGRDLRIDIEPKKDLIVYIKGHKHHLPIHNPAEIVMYIFRAFPDVHKYYFKSHVKRLRGAIGSHIDVLFEELDNLEIEEDDWK